MHVTLTASAETLTLRQKGWKDGKVLIRENTAGDYALGLMLFLKLGHSFAIASSFPFLWCLSLYENVYLCFLSR